MPYNKRYRKRAVRRRRPVRRTRKPTVASINRKVMKIQKAIEWKHLDTFQDTPVSLSPFIYGLTNPVQGLFSTDRIGDKITTSSIQLRFQIDQADSAYNFMRVCVFRQRDLNHPSLLLDANTFFNTGSGSQAALPTLWQYNLSYFRNSSAKVVMDKIFKVQNSNNNNAKYFQIKIPYRRNIQYEDGTLRQNEQLILFAVSDSTAASHPTLSITTRLNYCDL